MVIKPLLCADVVKNLVFYDLNEIEYPKTGVATKSGEHEICNTHKME